MCVSLRLEDAFPAVLLAKQASFFHVSSILWLCSVSRRPSWWQPLGLDDGSYAHFSFSSAWAVEEADSWGAQTEMLLEIPQLRIHIGYPSRILEERCQGGSHGPCFHQLHPHRN